MLVVIPVAVSALWRRHGGVACFPGNGGSTLDAYPSRPVESGGSIASCQARCDTTERCVGVLYEAAGFLWTTHTNRNCYDGSGAVEIALNSEADADTCRPMRLAECQTQCVLVPGCTGIVWSTTGSDCCLRTDIRLSRCDGGDGEWNTYKLTTRSEGSGACWRLSAVTLASCDTQSEGLDTYLKDEAPRAPWWLTTNFVERTLMPRRYVCSPSSPPPGTCTLVDLRRMLPALQQQGYSVLNIDWPVHASPDALFQGFGIANATEVDPLLGSTDEWLAFVDAAHAYVSRITGDRRHPSPGFFQPCTCGLTTSQPCVGGATQARHARDRRLQPVLLLDGVGRFQAR